MASARCTADTRPVRLYLEHRATVASPVVVHLEACKVVSSDGLVLLHIADSRPLHGVEGRGDIWRTLLPGYRTC